ncbi:response regulator transcription factor [Bacillus spongiae]|uniref:Response regulator transcription factor n=1 Tax=Bacillus spongiae TaxID=2683610 RepID=A0ABU8HJA3_9BACI
MVNILLVEDQAIVRQGLKIMLEQDEKLRVVAEGENGQEAIQQLEHHLIDLVVMDIRMPVMNGLEATSKIKQRWPHIKILILTTFNDDEYAMRALKDGASGFLLKTSDRQQLIGAVHSILKGGMSIHEEVAAKVMPRLLHRPVKKEENLHEATREWSLTPRELSIVKLVGEGQTNKEIATLLHLSVGTVKNHLTQILQKLGLRDRTQLAIFAVKQGLV